MSESQSLPAAWTADSKAVLFTSDRNGKMGIFKQGLEQDAAETVVSGSEAAYTPRLSPDGSWVLYTIAPTEAGYSAPQRLMRVPVNGGPPELLLKAPIYDTHRCSTSPATLCAIAELSQDHKELVFTALDPIKGKVREIARFGIDSNMAYSYTWSLSPDGTRIAIEK